MVPTIAPTDQPLRTDPPTAPSTCPTESPILTSVHTLVPPIQRTAVYRAPIPALIFLPSSATWRASPHPAPPPILAPRVVPIASPLIHVLPIDQPLVQPIAHHTRAPPSIYSPSIVSKPVSHCTRSCNELSHLASVKLSPQATAGRRFHSVFNNLWAISVFDPASRQSLKHRTLHCHPKYKDIWGGETILIGVQKKTSIKTLTT